MPTKVITPTATPLRDEITDAKGVPMRLVPAGTFTMGSDADDALAECKKYRSDCSRDWFINEEPAHQVDLDAFYMDKFEVTNARYKACVDAGVCTPPQDTNSYTRSSYYDNSQYNNFPVINVDWNQAKTYCEWRGARLPSEAEWEKAARGTDGRTYPWGEGIDCDKANYSGCKGDTTEVGSYADGKSPYGLYDMAGNVWEWVSDWYDAYPGNTISNSDYGTKYRVLRGGSWYDSEYVLRTSYRGRDTPDVINLYVGFRCARSP
jgi:formylglycine-generating enzyme required for sulfatase activity